MKAPKVIGNILLLLLGIVFTVAGVFAYKITDHDFQTNIAQRITKYLSDKLGAQVYVGRTEINFFHSVSLKDVLILDQKKDTLLHTDELTVSLSVFKLFRKQYVIEKISMDHPNIYLHREPNAEDWNYQFIIDAFSGKSDSTKTSSPIDLNLKSLVLNQVHFVFYDEPNYTKLDFAMPLLNVDMNKLDLNQPKIDMKQLLFDHADLKIVKYKEPPTPDEEILNDTGVVHINTKSIQLFIDDFELRDSKFSYDDWNEPPDTSQFDAVHQSYTNLDLHFLKCSLVLDTIKAHFENISLKEKSGFVLNHMEADVRVTPKLASASHLKIQTPYSSAKDSFSFSYVNFHSFYDVNANVVLSILLKQSKISMKDIGYFIGGLRGINETVLADGMIRGPIDNLKGKNLKLFTGSNTRFFGNIELKGLPEIEETYIDLSIDQLITNASDLKKLLPDVAWPDEIVRAGNIQFGGNFTGFYNDFVAYGSFNTELGGLTSDLNLKFKNGMQSAVYSGKLSAQDFNLGRMIAQDSLLGNITFAMNLKGSGFDFATMSATLNGTVDQIDFNDYVYHNASIIGTLDKKIFNGQVKLADENARVDFAGLVDFNKDLPDYDFKARIDSANLDKLNLTTDPYTVSAGVEMKLQGKNIDDFIGHVQVSSVDVSLNNKSWYASAINLTIKEPGDSNAARSLTLDAPFLHAYLNGTMAITKLPQSFLGIINHYFTALPGEFPDNDDSQDFDFHISLQHSSGAIHFFLPDWGGIEATQIDGHFNSKAHSIQFAGTIPALTYKDIDFGDVYLQAKTFHDSLLLVGGSRSFHIGDSIHINHPGFTLLFKRDTANLMVRGSSPDSSTFVYIRSVVTGDSSKLKLHFEPSTVTINERPWTLSPNNLVTYSDARMVFENFTLQSEQRSLTISNVNLRVRATNLAFDLKDIPISDFHEIININNYAFKGDVSGHAEILNIFNEPRVDANMVIKNFNINGTPISSVTTEIKYEPESDKISIAAKLEDEDFDVDAIGAIFPQKETDQLNLDLNIRKADPLLMESLFFEGLISGTSGNCNGTLQIGGTFANPLLTGHVMLESLTTTISYLRTTYHCYHAPITFNTDNIDLGKFVLYDQHDDSAIVQGSIHHSHLDAFNMNVSVTTKRFMALNTTQKDDSIFFGTAEASGLIRFLGPVENIEIDASVRSLTGTNISIPISSGSTAGTRPFIRYIKKNQDSIMVNTIRSTAISGMRMNLNMEITPAAIIQIIFDAATGDIVTGSGTGTIRMEVDTKGEFNMYGQFTIEQGSYVFTQFNFFNKNFIIENGGTINWNGDPYEAKIDFSAIYTTRASLYDLVTNTALLTSQDIKDLQQRTRVDLYLNLTGSLFEPQISFDIKLPESSALNNAAYLELNRIKRDENELNRQAFALLVLGRFLPPESGLGNIGVSDVGNSISSFLSNQISNLASSWRQDIDLTVNYQNYYYTPTASSGTASDATKRSELQVELTKRFFNDRLAVDVGGTYDYSAANTSTTAASSNIAGDFSIEYKITPDGRVSGKVYSRSSYDYIDATNKQNNGVSLKYTRDFDTLKELFKDPEKQKRKERKRREKELEQNPPTKEDEPTSVK